MINKIDTALKPDGKIKIMTHIVAGYPDLKTNIEMIKLMADSGVSMVEIQIPFSDPMADGPAIMKANQYSLDHGTKVEDCFELVNELNKQAEIPLLFMCYGNIPYRIGFKKFIRRSSDVGISGFIIPDLPFDEETDEYLISSKENNIHPIQVISPDINNERLEKIIALSGGFIYTTLKVGITGARKEIQNESIKFLSYLKQKTVVPIAAGFGISSVNQIEELNHIADIAIIGSHLLNLYDKGGLESLKLFLEEVCGG